MLNISQDKLYYCQKKAFLVSKPLDCDFYLSIKEKIEETEGMKIGAPGKTSDYLKKLNDDQPLGAGKLITIEDLGFSHRTYDTDKDAYLDAFQQCAAATQFGVLVPAGTIENWKKWAASEACREEVKNVPNDRIFAYIEHQEDDAGGKKGYIIEIGDELSSSTVEDGNGYALWKDGGYFHGMFQDGLKNGYGICLDAFGDGVFDGIWKDDKYNGRGKCTYANGDVYDGEWKECHKDGNGKMTHADGTTYDGEWKDDKFHGQGHQKFSDGGFYFGSFKNGNFHGNGLCKGNDGGLYDGEWKNGKKHGEGRQLEADGTVSIGTFKNNVFQGQKEDCRPGKKLRN